MNGSEPRSPGICTHSIDRSKQHCAPTPKANFLSAGSQRYESGEPELNGSAGLQRFVHYVYGCVDDARRPLAAFQAGLGCFSSEAACLQLSLPQRLSGLGAQLQGQFAAEETFLLVVLLQLPFATSLPCAPAPALPQREMQYLVLHTATV